MGQPRAADRADAEPPGLPLAPVQRWFDVHRLFDAHRPGRGPLRAELIAGGRSNLTYRVTDGTSTWALRRPPLGHVLPTAHDMGREYRVISALAGTPVPVPVPYGRCDDVDVIGAPFYVMSFVEGLVADTAERVATLNRDRARRAGEVLVDTLLDLHQVEPGAVGLGDFGRPDGFLARQVSRWHRQFAASVDGSDRLEDEVVAALGTHRPESGPAAVVHGDYRLTNVILAPDASAVRAVVDWEMATVGDPLTDVGLLSVYHRLAEGEAGVMPRMATDDGFLTAADLVARYRAGSERDLSAVGWYIAFGYYKLAVISAGIAARHRAGQTVGAGFEHYGERVPELLALARQAMAEEEEV